MAHSLTDPKTRRTPPTTSDRTIPHIIAVNVVLLLGIGGFLFTAMYPTVVLSTLTTTLGLLLILRLTRESRSRIEQSHTTDHQSTPTRLPGAD